MARKFGVIKGTNPKIKGANVGGQYYKEFPPKKKKGFF